VTNLLSIHHFDAIRILLATVRQTTGDQTNGT